tara:strand:+ start:256 stop:696 length:441 start_codon:yes stop_codon:yes gene_type:complete
MRERRRTLKTVKKAVTKLLWEIQSLEWALLFLEAPNQGEGEMWRMQGARTIERALKNYRKILGDRLKVYDIKPTDVSPLTMVDGSSIPRKVFPKPPFGKDDKVTEPGEEASLEYKFGGNDPRFEKLTALELKSLSRWGSKEYDSEL